MATYKFDNFQAEITDPTIAVVGVHDSMNGDCSVDITLTKGATILGVNLTGFTYETTWEDSDISTFVTSKLSEFSI